MRQISMTTILLDKDDQEGVLNQKVAIEGRNYQAFTFIPIRRNLCQKQAILRYQDAAHTINSTWKEINKFKLEKISFELKKVQL